MQSACLVHRTCHDMSLLATNFPVNLFEKGYKPVQKGSNSNVSNLNLQRKVLRNQTKCKTSLHWSICCLHGPQSSRLHSPVSLQSDCTESGRTPWSLSCTGSRTLSMLWWEPLQTGQQAQWSQNWTIGYHDSAQRDGEMNTIKHFSEICKCGWEFSN